MSPDKLSWIIALLTELRDNPGSVLEVQIAGTWKPIITKYGLNPFRMERDRYRVVKVEKYRVLQYKDSGQVAVVLCTEQERRSLIEARVSLGQARWLTDWLPIPEQK